MLLGAAFGLRPVAEGSADVAGMYFPCLSMQALYCGSPNSGKLLTLADG